MKPLHFFVPIALMASAANYSNTANAFDFRIIGGKPVDISSRPWMVALVVKGTAATDAFCGASLIAPQWVLTAAHCVLNSTAASLDIVAGVAELDDPNAERISVSRIIAHPNYNDNSLENDIALLKLETPSSQKTVAYKVPANGDSAGTQVTVSGWGNLSTSGQQYPTKLHSVDLLVSDFPSCNRAYGGGLSDKHLCASNPGGTKDSCEGDRGGPLVARIQSKDVQLGVVSFGAECASATNPGVYTRVSQYEEFINQTIGNAAIVAGDNTGNTPVDNNPAQPDNPSAPVDEENTPETEVPVVAPDVIETIYPMTVDNEYPSEIIVDTTFDSVIVGQNGYAWLGVYNGSNVADAVVSNLQIRPSTAISITYNECDNAELQADGYCAVELEWSPKQPGDLTLDVSIDLFDGAETETLSATLTGKALDKIDIGPMLEQPGTDFFTDNELNWEINYDNAHKGSECLQTAAITDNEPVVLEGDFDVKSVSDLSFSYTVQGGVLVLFINGEEVLELDTVGEWQLAEYELPAQATVAWEFRPDAQARVAPKARIDGISLQPKQVEAEPDNEPSRLAAASDAQQVTGSSAGGGSFDPWSLASMLSIAGLFGWNRRRCA